MKSLLVALALLAPLPAHAASVTCAAGSICLPYVNGGDTVVFNPSATISNGTGATFLAWCHAYYIATASAVTDGGCYNTWANDWFNQTIVRMTDAAKTTAATAATGAVVPPAIVPKQ